MKRYLILLFLSTMQLGCTHPTIPVEISNPVVKTYGYEKDAACKDKNCRYNKTSEILLNIDTQQNKVTYHMEKAFMGKWDIKELHDGKLTNCNVISKSDFYCDELRSKDGLLSIATHLDYQTFQRKENNEPFKEYVYFSESQIAQVLSSINLLNSSSSEIIDNYSFIIYIIIGLFILAAVSKLEGL